MEYEYNKKENKFTENGHTMFMEDVLQRLKRLAHLESRIKELENNTTEVIMTKVHTGLGSASFQERAECCNMPSKLFNFCPNCGRKIVR